MAKKCWRSSGIGCDNVFRSGYFCSENLVVVGGGVCGGVILVDAEGRSAANPAYYSAISQAVEQVSCSNCSGCCQNPDVVCDCVNGGCVPATTYNTPGVYASLAACQSGCAQNSPCTGECVDPAEIAALNQAISSLRPRICH
jgi:hypothetical protein